MCSIFAICAAVSINPNALTDLTLKEGTNTIVYAWGSAADSNLKLAVQTIAGMDTAPGGVPAGTGPADSSVPTILLVVLLTIGATAVVIGGRRLYSPSRRLHSPSCRSACSC